MKLIPINQFKEDNLELAIYPECAEIMQMTIDNYARVGFIPPWIGYFAEEAGNLIGCGGFKGKPINGRIEIAYYTFPEHENRGIGTAICKMLVEIAINTDPTVTITARTLPEKNQSGSILQKNGFRLTGPVEDEEDGQVWEWVYEK